MITTIATNASQIIPWIDPDDLLAGVVLRDEPEVREHQVRDGLDQRHDLQRLGHALSFGDGIVGEVGHAREGTLHSS